MVCDKCNNILPDDSKFCQYCGNTLRTREVIAREPINSIRQESTGKQMPLVNMLSIIISLVAIGCVVAAMNVQDIERNIYEVTDPTMLYAILIGIFAVCAGLFLLSQKQVYPIAQHLFAFAPAVFVAVAWMEGSVFSVSYQSYMGEQAYINTEVVMVLNILWVVAALAVAVINFIPLGTNTRVRWHRSIRYRESCYRRVAKMKGYLDSGIITQEEFEKNKKDLLKDIEM